MGSNPIGRATPYGEGTKELDKSVGLEAQSNPRAIRGQAIAQIAGSIYKDQERYRVHSQTRDWFYTVTPHETEWTCSCLDFLKRGVPWRKHIFAVQFSLQIRDTVKVERENRETVIEQFNASSCLHCGSPSLKKFGVRHNKDGDIQQFHNLSDDPLFQRRDLGT